MKNTSMQAASVLLIVLALGGEVGSIAAPSTGVASSSIDQPSSTPPPKLPNSEGRTGASAGEQGSPALATGPLRIVELLDGSQSTPASGNLGLNHKLWVVLNRAPDVAAERYVLLLNGVEVKDSGPASAITFPTSSNVNVHALVFKIQRTKDSDPFWKDLLGSPLASKTSVTVALKGQGDAGSTTNVLIGGDPAKTSFQFQVFTPWRLGWATLAVLIAIALIWGHARTQTTLRDNLLPQLPPSQQPYSLGRWQMAFWFTLVFVSFVFLFVLLWDYNTITGQALTLLGISGATALASVAVDVAKDSPADAANRGLRALGLNTYVDVLRIRQEIANRQAELMQNPTPARLLQLQTEIQDRNNILRTYDDTIRPFVSQGWFKDITTDINGVTVHRLQVVIWTLALGIVFLIGVYRDLSMPEFSVTLLALMGISGATYVGFKYPEVNN